ncbi:MAG TPA: hypothetical protein VJS39_10940 [Gemmatimonadaceae bacterium]|nr:hypothetical protein [Gemmatimonadaceae bacterium]
MKSLLLLSICAISIAGSVSAVAQPSIIKQGATVRFRTTVDDSSRTGPLATLTPDSLVLARCLNCDRLLYGRAEIKDLEVMRPTPSGDRIISGLLLGGAVGGGLGWLSASTCHGADRCDLSALAIPFGAIAGAVIGGFVGYITSYKWEPVPATTEAR